MSWSDKFFLFFAIYMAPHVTSNAAVIIAATFLIFGMLSLWEEKCNDRH